MTRKVLFDNKVDFVVTMASLANDSANQSDEVDNSTTRAPRAHLSGKIKANASGVSPTGMVHIYAFGSSDDQATRTENAGATAAAITVNAQTNLKLIDSIHLNANGMTAYFGPLNIENAFGGTLPKYFGIVIQNKSGAALDSTGSNHSIAYQMNYDESVA